MRLPTGKTILHTGDFRAENIFQSYPVLQEMPIDVVYLDTTYCNPSYDFPSQQHVVEYVVGVCERHLSDDPTTLFVSGTYTIGKERVFQAVAERFGYKVGVTKQKMKILSCLVGSRLPGMLTLNQHEAQVHVVDMKSINFNVSILITKNFGLLIYGT